MEPLRRWAQECDNIVFFGGAGISTESGIPDFRSETGLYAAKEKYGRSPEQLLTHSFFMAHPQEFFAYYRESFVAMDAKPNAAHLALAELERRGKLRAVVTQNVDGLHQAAGSQHVLELHGSNWRQYCMDCGKQHSLAFVMAAKGIPRCEECGGIVRPDVVLYEEGLDDATVAEAIHAIRGAEMLIVGGTSLAVYPAAGLLRYFQGEHLVLINKSPTPRDQDADLVIHDALGKTLAACVE